ncbi:hypothetical protein C8T65DRAFT_644806 [Cerioporus squamosus]|nr:hypothetical protein C8T65DRAFT_644806 [Cerioporus squamosus]
MCMSTIPGPESSCRPTSRRLSYRAPSTKPLTPHRQDKGTSSVHRRRYDPGIMQHNKRLFR